ncbi:Rus Holliday junction resolvase [uncultured Caudovirales phage]|uniref:Rus Holliday junction resolvase n=1 Tax=uncultured Caudovirales phage TaxID=2100421 RepID=A0A6J7XGR7_9CAUD|nr:Rus Holliday junction resolvase [uncultured Caudovirales phage]CAB4212957.1 Rus Holliday junction resolvase [uncultured Caudovirales phage]CAB5228347.1 Rus Holliday junction resolvase [uncultured Caudovirales phage]
MPIILDVQGTPRPQPRPRFVRGRVVSTADANARRWIATVEAGAKALVELRGKQSGPLAVAIGFRFPTRDKARHGKPHTFRPDVDNLAKLILDCLMRAGLIDDDACVSSLAVQKTWDETGRAVVWIEADTREDGKPAPLPRWLSN